MSGTMRSAAVENATTPLSVAPAAERKDHPHIPSLEGPPDESKISSPLISVSIRPDPGDGPSFAARKTSGMAPSPQRSADTHSPQRTGKRSLSGDVPLSAASSSNRAWRGASPITMMPPSTLASPNSNNNVAAKRPYIRTKRPKDYNHRSTVTTTTDALYRSAVNPYDAVLAESNDLLAAAHEAQQLGRYKMASTYLLLLHARLVGLGRRFDKMNDGDDDDDDNDNDYEEEEQEEEGNEVNGTNEGGKTYGDVAATAAATSATQRHSATPSGAAVPSAPDRLLTPKTRAVKEFTKLLPKDIQLDQAMMEHLAKAAVELHAARSGQRHHPHGPAPGTGNCNNRNSNKFPNNDPKHQHHPHLQKSLYRVPDTHTFLAGTANSRGITTAATAALAAAGAKQAPFLKSAPAATTATATTTAATTAGIAWTDDEIRILNRARASSDPRLSAASAGELAALLPGRTEQQVRMYLKNQNERQRLHMEAMETLSEEHRQHQELPPDPSSAYPKHNLSDPMAAAVDADAAGEDAAVNPAGVSDGSILAHDEFAHASSGRGAARKPVTAAIYTAPHAICDARVLLSQARKERQEQMERLEQEQQQQQQQQQEQQRQQSRKDDMCTLSTPKRPSQLPSRRA